MSKNYFGNKILQKLGFILLPTLITVLCRTLKVNEKNSESFYELFSRGENFVLAFWHGMMIVPWYYFRNKNISALISKSRDGDILSNLLDKWNYKVVRGSSNNGGKEAFNQMIELAASKNSLAITVDGPKGPINKMKAGAVVISQRTNTPLFLIGVSYKKYFELNSWDKFRIPKPFSEVNLVFSDRINFEKSDGKEVIDIKITDTENMLNELQKKAEIF